MPDPRKQLTEEIPETPEDFKNRQLTEVGGEIKADRQQITEDLPQEEDEDSHGRRTLLG